MSTLSAQTTLAPVLTGTLGLGCVLLFYLAAWVFVGRRPRRGDQDSTGPIDFPAGAVRYIRTMRFDDRIYAATLLSLAVKGHLKLDYTSNPLKMIRRRPDKASSQADLSASERALLGKLFHDKAATCEVSPVNGRALLAGREGLRRMLKSKYNAEYLRKNGWFLVIGVVLTLAVWFWLALETTRDRETLISAFQILALCFLAAFILIPLAIKARQMAWSRQALWPLLLPLPAALPILAAFAASGLKIAATLPLDVLVLGVAAIFMNGVFFHWIKAHSSLGAKIAGRIEGLRTELKQFELNANEPASKNYRALRDFQEKLPFAVALDVEKEWTRAFEPLLKARDASPAPLVQGWVSGVDDPLAFFASLGERLSKDLGMAVAATPLSALHGEETRPRRYQDRFLGASLLFGGAGSAGLGGGIDAGGVSGGGGGGW